MGALGLSSVKGEREKRGDDLWERKRESEREREKGGGRAEVKKKEKRMRQSRVL